MIIEFEGIKQKFIKPDDDPETARIRKILRETLIENKKLKMKHWWQFWK